MPSGWLTAQVGRCINGCMTDATVQTDAAGQPIGPIHLPAKLHEILMEKAGVIEKTRGPDVIPTMLRAMSEIEKVLSPMIENFVAVMRSFGNSWSDIGEALGVSKQAAWERYKYLDNKLPRGVVYDNEHVASSRSEAFTPRP